MLLEGFGGKMSQKALQILEKEEDVIWREGKRAIFPKLHKLYVAMNRPEQLLLESAADAASSRTIPIRWDEERELSSEIFKYAEALEAIERLKKVISGKAPGYEILEIAIESLPERDVVYSEVEGIGRLVFDKSRKAGAIFTGEDVSAIGLAEYGKSSFDVGSSGKVSPSKNADLLVSSALYRNAFLGERAFMRSELPLLALRAVVPKKKGSFSGIWSLRALSSEITKYGGEFDENVFFTIADSLAREGVSDFYSAIGRLDSLARKNLTPKNSSTTITPYFVEGTETYCGFWELTKNS